MKYTRFKINAYKAISTPIDIAIDKENLVPIIGVNECGKTTILKAILAFDYHNDAFDNLYHHLQDTNNLYDAGSEDAASITATISISKDELKDVIRETGREAAEDKTRSYIGKLGNKSIENISITRRLNPDDKSYSINLRIFDSPAFNDILAKHIIRKLPYILYFDDFRDHVPDRIEIDAAMRDNPSGWLAVVERLFNESDSKFSIFEIEEKDERARKTPH